MIAVITSTIKPEDKNGQSVKSFYSYPERVEQTKDTLTALQNNGFTSIFLVDNSPGLTNADIKTLLADFPDVSIFHIHQYQFANKGINELLMLLYICNQLPANKTIFKISGRYKPNSLFKKPDFNTIAARGYDFKSKTGTISTRAYWVQDVAFFESFLLKCLNEVFAYPERVVGVRSFYKKVQGLFSNKAQQQLNISIEFAAANVLKQNNYRPTLLNVLGIEGLVAGSDDKENITE